mgnify:FL=1
MTEQVNTPELRFPEFTEKLILQKLNSVASVTMGQSPKSSNYTDDFKQMTLVQGNADLKNGKINSRIYTTEITKIAKVQDIILTVRAPVGELAIAQKEVCIGRGVCAIKANKFVYYFLEKLKINKLWTRLSQGSTFEAISGNDIKNINVTLPSKKEQTKIGDFFSKLDRQIELEEEKLKLLEQQKRGYMQKIFSRELRFKDENGNDYPDWKLKKLSNIADIIGGGTPSTKKSEYWDGDINWFSPVEIGDKEFVSTSQRRITEKGLEKSSAKMLPIGTVLFTSRAGIGKTAILSKEATTNQGFQSIVPKENDLDSYFLYSMTSILKRNAEKVGAGSTFSEVSRKQMEQIKLLIPILKEQKQIGRLFQIINRKINKQIHKIELLKQRKKGLLQKMFV